MHSQLDIPVCGNLLYIPIVLCFCLSHSITLVSSGTILVSTMIHSENEHNHLLIQLSLLCLPYLKQTLVFNLYFTWTVNTQAY